MVSKGDEKFLKDLNPFSKGLPRTTILFIMLFMLSAIMGIAAVALINHNSINSNFSYIVVNGSVTGILAIMLPTLLTVIIVKAFKRYVDLKHILFISIIGTISYSIFILLGSLVYITTSNYVISSAIILVGDASIFGWWFFVDKVVLGQRKRAVFLALVQPTINILLYLPSSKFILSLSTPFNTLLLKLYAGIFIFLIISYMIIYVVDRPYKKNYGFHSFDAVSQMIQNWLFDANISTPFGTNFGAFTSIRTDTIVFKNMKGAVKGIFFIPDIHYGPSGTLGGSNFPYLLERHSLAKYGAPTFIMHCAVDMDHNPISSNQFNTVKDSLDNGIKNSVLANRKGSSFASLRSDFGNSKVMALRFGSVSLVTMTRAPKVTEDISLESAVLFKELLDAKLGTSILIDAHNSRYETAPKSELDGVKFNSVFATEYVEAIKRLGKEQHKGKTLRMGIASNELYFKLGCPNDIARGNLNVAAFRFNGNSSMIIQINSNNALPTLRNSIVRHVKQKYGIDAELYTTDTHAVNSLEFNASNALGRCTKYQKLEGILDKTIDTALSNMEQVNVYHKTDELKKFKVWGQDAMENIIATANSTFSITRLIVPIIIVAGFIIAAWVILII